MRAAILIIAHDQPSHLATLVDSLSCDWTRIFIHIDRKVDITEFQQCIPEHNASLFLDFNHRIRINWGGFSQVQATLNLLDASLNFGEQFDRFCLLSGSDFPIKSLDEIKMHLDSEKEFMRIDRRLDVSDDNTHCKNVRYYHFLDSPFPKTVKNIHARCLPKIPRKAYDKISLYHGCNWWALTIGCVRFIAEFLQHNKDYVTFHKHTLCADEIFFNSIVKFSPFAANITHDFESVIDQKSYFSLNEHGCHYIDWNAEGLTLPKVLNESDFSRLLNSEALFARKFREPESSNLLYNLKKAIGM